MASRHMAKERGWTVRQCNQKCWEARRMGRLAEKGLCAVPSPQEGLPRATVNNYGVPLNEAWARDVARLQRQYKRAKRLLQDARDIIAKTLDAKLPVHTKETRSLMKECTRLASLINSMSPIALCPYCKGIDSVQKTCIMCKSLGYMTVGQNFLVPPELRDINNRRVQVGREFVPIGDFIEPPTSEVIDEPR
jgi:hypothetical protein